MYIRRYYKKGLRYPYTVNDAYKEVLIEKYGELRADKIDNADYEIILEGIEEEAQWFHDCCKRVMANTRWYLDNLDKLATFSIHTKEVCPFKTTNNTKTETFI